MSFDECVSFTVEKERYTPYIYFKGVFFGEHEPSDISRVEFYCDFACIHSGIASKVYTTIEGGKKTISVESYGFTALLGQNQSEPGIISNATLAKIMTRNEDFFGISYQLYTKAVNYIYIENNSTLWDAVATYAYKAYNNYPYITQTNYIRCEKLGIATLYYNEFDIVKAGRGVNLTNLVSNAYTADTEGGYSFAKTNDYAMQRNLKKYKYMDHRNDFLYDLNEQSNYYIKLRDRGREYTYFTYCGFRNEEICDQAVLNCGGISLNAAEISRVIIKGSDKCVYTTVYCYNDSF